MIHGLRTVAEVSVNIVEVVRQVLVVCVAVLFISTIRKARYHICHVAVFRNVKVTIRKGFSIIGYDQLCLTS